LPRQDHAFSNLGIICSAPTYQRRILDSKQRRLGLRILDIGQQRYLTRLFVGGEVRATVDLPEPRA
jgi:hypothetical protein